MTLVGLDCKHMCTQALSYGCKLTTKREGSNHGGEHNVDQLLYQQSVVLSL